MSVDVVDCYNRGMTWNEFLASSEKNVGRMESFFDEFEVDEDTAAFFNNRSPLQILAIGEDWCPDVVQNLAMLARICTDVPGLELSIVRRDENPQLMDQYLTDGKKRIPTLVFFDSTFAEIARWAGRCDAAQRWIDEEILRGRGWKELGEDELDRFQEEYDRRFRSAYARETLAAWMMLMEDEGY